MSGNGITEAEHAVHSRSALACGAAARESVPGQFRTWQHDDLLVVSATDPRLAFLSTVAGVRQSSVSSAVDLARASCWRGSKPTLVLSPACDAAARSGAERLLSEAGFVRVDDRTLAIRPLAGDPDGWPDADVSEDPATDAFVRVLLTGYSVNPTVAAFIAAEHLSAAVHRYFLHSEGAPIAAAAMTLHGDVAVLGGASTLPEHRGRGAQTRLLQHRLRAATAAGCVLAVATAVPDSVSETNLRRSGFRILRRSAWTIR
jgi:ribosomal protein S18 acetylase RimI-like enzyme